MLIRFNIKNFLSFATKDDGTSEEFSMLAGKVRSKKDHLYKDDNISILKFGAVFGANASGKSNLVKAFDFMQTTITEGLPEGHTEKYCRVNPANKEKSSYFELEIKLNDKYYAYGFEILLNESKFLSEWLVELTPDNKQTVLFERDIENGKYNFGGLLSEKNTVDKMKNYADDIRNDSSVLFLTIMNQNKRDLYNDFENARILQDVFLWIQVCLDINYADSPISNYRYMSNLDNVEEVCKIISAFGTGITGFELVEIPYENALKQMPREAQKDILSKIENISIVNKQIKGNKKLKFNSVIRSNKDFFIIDANSKGDITCKTLQFSHTEEKVLFDIFEESDGTIRILDLIEILLTEKNKTYVIDELDRCLHPNLTYKFIESFLDVAKEKNIQLIVTTHESRLLDFELLRRDEIWFTNKKKSGETDIYSLEEYNERFDKKIDKAYLEGRYEGVPIFNTVFPVTEGL